jgi:site-specific recombinase XerD
LFLPSASRKHRNTNGALSPRLINAIVEHIAVEANNGLPEEEQIHLHPHMFRHTHAYQILKKGRSLTYVQKRLGHQSMNYLALYTQMPEGEEKELLDEAEFK